MKHGDGSCVLLLFYYFPESDYGTEEQHRPFDNRFHVHLRNKRTVPMFLLETMGGGLSNFKY